MVSSDPVDIPQSMTGTGRGSYGSMHDLVGSPARNSPFASLYGASIVGSYKSGQSPLVLGEADGGSAAPQGEGSAWLEQPLVLPHGKQVVQVNATEDVWGELERLLYGENERSPFGSPQISSVLDGTLGSAPLLRLDTPHGASDAAAASHSLVENAILSQLVAEGQKSAMETADGTGGVLELTLEKTVSGQPAFSFTHAQEPGAALASQQPNGITRAASRGNGKRRGFIIVDAQSPDRPHRASQTPSEPALPSTQGDTMWEMETDVSGTKPEVWGAGADSSTDDRASIASTAEDGDSGAPPSPTAAATAAAAAAAASIGTQLLFAHGPDSGHVAAAQPAQALPSATPTITSQIASGSATNRVVEHAGQVVLLSCGTTTVASTPGNANSLQSSMNRPNSGDLTELSCARELMFDFKKSSSEATSPTDTSDAPRKSLDVRRRNFIVVDIEVNAASCCVSGCACF